MAEKSSTQKTFRLKPKAENDLENIYAYSYRAFGQIRAKRYIHELSATFKQLAEDAALGRDMSLIRKGIQVYPVNSHVIFYKTTGFGITVIRVLHKSMDYDNRL